MFVRGGKASCKLPRKLTLCFPYEGWGGGGCPNCGLGEEESGKWLYCTDLQTLHLFKNKSI